MTITRSKVITGLSVFALCFMALAGSYYSIRSVFAAPSDAIPEAAIDIATDIQGKSNRVAEIDKNIETLLLEKTKAVASAHALDTVLCADYGYKFNRVGTGSVMSGLVKGDCPLQ